MTAKRKPTTPNPTFPKVIETFQRVDDYHLGRMASPKPSVGNGEVSIRRYRVTVEEIAEPVEVLIDRLRRLWRGTNNYHHKGPLRDEAHRLGIILDPEEWGTDVRSES